VGAVGREPRTGIPPKIHLVPPPSSTPRDRVTRARLTKKNAKKNIADQMEAHPDIQLHGTRAHPPGPEHRCRQHMVAPVSADTHGVVSQHSWI
jgi:hypothetical protein